MSNVIHSLSQTMAEKKRAVLATVVNVDGSSPAKVGAQILLFADGTTAGTIGGGKLEADVLKAAQQALESMTPSVHHFGLRETGKDAIGMICGGEVTVFVHPYAPPPQLIIVGGGHIGRPLKIMGEAAGFEVTVVDVQGAKGQVTSLDQVPLNADSYVVIITTGHASDEAALRIALGSAAPYIGMIGSMTKCKTIFQHLKADGYQESDLARVYAPIGLDLGGDAPQEIAVAILAEVIACRHKHGIPERLVKTMRIG